MKDNGKSPIGISSFLFIFSFKVLAETKSVEVEADAFANEVYPDKTIGVLSLF